MRLALISDIHANLPALEAVLADAAREGVDGFVCLGDLATNGPYPGEVIERVRALGCPAVLGNGDAALLRAATDSWYRRGLRREHLAFLETLRPTVEVDLGGGATLLCFHGSPRSYDDFILATTPPAELDALLADHQATVLAGGHTHVQMIRRHRQALVVNPGSVGLAWDQNPWSGEVPREAVRLASRAEYAVLSWEQGRLGVELRRVPFDVEAVRRAARERGMPDWERYCALWPSEPSGGEG